MANKNTKLVYATAPDADEAMLIARTLVDERLIACANIIDGVRSIYRWQDKVEDAKEIILVMKTVEKNVDAINKKIKSMHSYDCPCVVVVDITDGNDDFLKWISDETSNPA